MTIINGLEIDNIDYKKNDIKYAIQNNDPIEEKLNVILVISNPCLYKRRYRLLKEFLKRMEEEENIEIYIVEMIYNKQQFAVTQKNNKNHLQLKTSTPLWHKENMINLGVKYLLPKNWKAFAWIDADIEFESTTWVKDTLKLLNGSKDVVQLFSHAIDMDRNKNTLNIFNGFGYSYCKNKKYTNNGKDYWHPGYAWAITRKAYEKIGGLFDKGILGSGDGLMAMSFINKADILLNMNYDEDYKKSIIVDYQKKSKQLRLGYTPGVIRHYYHGTKENRKYTERWKILIKYEYSPKKHVIYNHQGIIIPSKECPQNLLTDIYKYFQERKEDD
jgi:hypothetical protein